MTQKIHNVFHGVSTTDDERFAFLNISDRGKGLDGNAIWFTDQQSADKSFKPIIAEPENFHYSIVDNIGLSSLQVALFLPHPSHFYCPLITYL